MGFDQNLLMTMRFGKVKPRHGVKEKSAENLEIVCNHDSK